MKSLEGLSPLAPDRDAVDDLDHRPGEGAGRTPEIE